MTLDEFNARFDPIYNTINDPLTHSKIIRVVDGLCVDATAVSSKLPLESKLIIDPSIMNFYTYIEEWRLKWSTKPEINFKANGSFDFIHFNRVFLESWDDELGGTDWAPDMLGFRPLDMFYDSDGMVGFFVNRPEKEGLYLMHSDSSISTLHVNFDGYLKLLAMSKGFGWWQNALVQISTGEEMPNVASFKEKMPQIFPDFSWDAFVELYQSLRIDK